MPRATAIIAAHDRRNLAAADSVLLDHAQRAEGVLNVATVKGQEITIDLKGAPRLRSDDLIALDDGSHVEVVAKPEALIEARGADVAALARIAWHLGDRHIAVQLLPNRVRALRQPATEELLRSLGAKVMMIEAPFEPEGGAYDVPSAHAHHDHAHRGHDHAHHGHEHHDHHAHGHHGHKHDDHEHGGHDHSHGHHLGHGHRHD